MHLIGLWTLTVVMQVVVPRAYYGSKTVLIMEFLRGQKLVTALQARGVHDVRGCDLVTGLREYGEAMTALVCQAS